MFSEMPPQLTGLFEDSLKAEWSVPGLAVLWGVLIPMRLASWGLSVWLSPFLITPEQSEQLLLLHICDSISRTCEVTYAERTSPHGPLSPPWLTWQLCATHLHSAVCLSLSIFGSFNFRLKLTIFLFFSPWSMMMFNVIFITEHDGRQSSLAQNK